MSALDYISCPPNCWKLTGRRDQHPPRRGILVAADLATCFWGTYPVMEYMLLGQNARIKFRARSTTTRDRDLQFRGAVSTGFFEFPPVDLFPEKHSLPGESICTVAVSAHPNTRGRPKEAEHDDTKSRKSRWLAGRGIRSSPPVQSCGSFGHAEMLWWRHVWEFTFWTQLLLHGEGPLWLLHVRKGNTVVWEGQFYPGGWARFHCILVDSFSPNYQ